MPLRVRKNRAPAPPQVCPLMTCMSLIGGAWTPNIIWHLSGGPRRFGELKLDIPPITARMLSKRLRELERDGVVTRHVMPSSPPSVEYRLTELGRELLPSIQAIVDVGAKLAAKTGRSIGRRAEGARLRAQRHAATPRI
jgi:DNA-binding HxlR family transcriptional regulator